MDDPLEYLGLSEEELSELRDWLFRRTNAGMSMKEALKDHPSWWAPFPSLIPPEDRIGPPREWIG